MLPLVRIAGPGAGWTRSPHSGGVVCLAKAQDRGRTLRYGIRQVVVDDRPRAQRHAGRKQNRDPQVAAKHIEVRHKENIVRVRRAGVQTTSRARLQPGSGGSPRSGDFKPIAKLKRTDNKYHSSPRAKNLEPGYRYDFVKDLNRPYERNFTSTLDRSEEVSPRIQALKTIFAKRSQKYEQKSSGSRCTGFVTQFHALPNPTLNTPPVPSVKQSCTISVSARRRSVSGDASHPFRRPQPLQTP